MTLLSTVYELKLIVTEALDGLDIGLTTAPNAVHQLTGLAGTSQPSGTSIITSVPWRDTVALVAGAKTLDLTSLDYGDLTAKDFTGLKVQFALFKNPSGNGTMNIKTGAANGYNIFGATASEITLIGGGAALFVNPEGTPDVSGSAKTIDIAGTGTESLEVILVAG